MKVIKISLKVLGLALVFVQTAQSQTTINGKLSDSAGNPIPFANVLLSNAADSVLIKGAVSAEDGHYQLTGIDAGDYLLSLSMIGYQVKYKSPIKILSGDKLLQLGTDILEEDIQQLGEVVVEARKPLFEQQMDKLVINVQSSITSVGSSVLEVLERAPGIAVNRQNGGLSMNGKAGVQVMINGKMNRLPLSAIVQMLSGMNAANIEKIELISSPPAKYEAEGDAGIINIILKENEDIGMNGNFSLTAGYGDAEKSGASLNMNQRNKKVNVYGDYSFMRNHTTSMMGINRFVEYRGEVTATNSISYRDPVILNHTGRLGVDYTLGKNTLLGVAFSGYSNQWIMDAFNKVSLSKAGRGTDLIEMTLDELNHWSNLSGNFNISHQMNEAQQLSFDLDYLYFNNDNPSNYLNQYKETESQDQLSEEVAVRKNTPIKIWVAKLDYTYAIGEKVNLEAGVKTAISHFTNDVSVQNRTKGPWITDSELTNIYELREDIGAAYAAFQASLSPDLDLNGGLRYEYTRSKLDSRDQKGLVDRKYGRLFPNISLAGKINEHQKVNVSYSRRITRPTFNDMAPFVIFVDPYTFFSGNAAVQPAFTNMLKLDYGYKSYLLSLQYSRDNNAIGRFQPEVDPETNIQLFIARNLKYIETYSLNLSLPFSIGRFWEMQYNIMGFQQSMATEYKGKEVQMNQLSLRLNSTHNFRLPRNYGIEISGMYQSPTMFGVYVFKPLGFVNAGVQKRLRNDKGILTLSFNDIFWTTTWRAKADLREENLNIDFSYFFEPRVLNLTYSRNFGNKSLKSLRKRNVGAEEERSRVTN